MTSKEYYQEHREQCCAASRKWDRKHRQEHPEECRAGEKVRSRRYHLRHMEEDNARRRKRRMEHPGKSRAATSKWSRANPEQRGNMKRRRRARKLGAPGSHTAAQVEFLRRITQGFCPGHNRDPHFVGADTLTVDHVVPLSRGGSDDVSNIQMMCRPCNSSKGTS